MSRSLDVQLANAAGTVKTLADALTLLKTPLTAITLGSYTHSERLGNPGSTYFETEIASLNSLGLPSPPMSVWRSWVSELLPIAKDNDKRLVVSIAGFNAREFAEMSQVVLEAGVDGVELNLGCPNIWDHGEQKRIFSYSPELVADVLGLVQTVCVDMGRVGVKLSPIFDAALLVSIDSLLREHQVAFVTTTNTVPNCFLYGISDRQAISFGSGLAGLGGPAILPIGLGQVRMHRASLPRECQIVGVGGISSGRDIADYLRAGASSCQVATLFLRQGPRVFARLLAEYVAEAL